ncbi:hypothetical protein ACOANN_21915 [Pseudomonas aeruginosa]|uniref:Uncharacterized protein n=2 Tax=Pseudomonas TaxID=286 RepID=A0AAJ5IDR0_9PSED|nr:MULTISPECIES: hypothetical protein [Pseudomonas]MCP8473035.1 hypothetical protein [Pseudomonas triclosanedens]MCP8479759.1 hypothetical protein [Pseudomonas triclosanedens]MCU9228914.1 hypothetical protein [Pseudomonas aeruginosa]MDE5270265.1 hypothetical protein [Pseudomonas aeruginosa]MDE5282834.1 hypothetical protein [Pseudomonas aeruginosa]
MNTYIPSQTTPNRLGADSRAWSARVRAEMQEMLQEWFNSATQCEEADVDHEFNRALEHLMIFAERPQDLVAEDASYDLATLPRFDQFCEESETARLSGEGAFIRYEHAAQLVRALELKVSQADFNYDSDRAAWQRREAELLALLGSPTTTPIHQCREMHNPLWEDCTTEDAEKARAEGLEVRTMYCLPEDAVRVGLEQENQDLRLQCGGMEMTIDELRGSLRQLQHQLAEISTDAVQGVEPVAKCGRGPVASFCHLTDYGRQVLPEGRHSLYLAAQVKNGVLLIPDNLLSHRQSWRAAFERLIELEPESHQPDCDERGFWKHELRAFDHMYADLDRIKAAHRDKV